MDNNQLDINKVELVGTLPRDPMYKTVGANATPLLTFTVMTTRKWIDPSTKEAKSQTQYNNVTAWRSLADNNSTLKMGSRVRVIGELQSRSWDNPTTGKKEYKTDVNALTIQKLGEGEVPSHDKSVIAPDDLPF